MILFKFIKRSLVVLFIFASIKCSNDNTKPISLENAKKGELLFNSVGCTKCHSLTGESRYGPSLIFTYDNEVIVYRKGKKVSVKLDRKYIIRAIKYPDYEKLNGYQDKKMIPPTLTTEEIDRIVDYLIYINTKGNP